MQPRQARIQLASGIEKGSKQVGLALARRVAGDTAHAKADAEQARNTLESLKKDQPDNAFIAAALAVAYAMLDEKDSALNEAQRATTLVPSGKDQLSGPGLEENLALVEVIIGENVRAISTLTRLLQTPYGGWLIAQRPLRRHFLGSIRSGTLCVPIPSSKNCVRKSSPDYSPLPPPLSFHHLFPSFLVPSLPLPCCPTLISPPLPLRSLTPPPFSLASDSSNHGRFPMILILGDDAEETVCFVGDSGGEKDSVRLRERSHRPSNCSGVPSARMSVSMKLPVTGS